MRVTEQPPVSCVQGHAGGFIKGDPGPGAKVWLSRGFYLLQALGHAGAL